MTFGEFFKMKRSERKLTLRKFCEMYSFDPGNISKLERGILAPPQSEEKLMEYANALGITKGSADYIQLFDLSSAENKNFTVKHITNDEVLKKLPILFRTLDRKGLTSDKLDKIIDYVRKERQG